MDAKEKRFWSKVDKSGGPDACWAWKKSTVGIGYGLTSVFSDSGKRYTANRLAWELANGRRVPRGQYVLHTCDNPSCCNPKHLFVGTQFDNMADMLKKGRGNKARGEEIGNSKLTAARVREIRRLWRRGLATRPELAEAFGVHRSTVERIINRKTWKHVKD